MVIGTGKGKEMTESPFFMLLLQWPYKELNPNTTGHWAEKARYKKQAKADAYQECKIQKPTIAQLYPPETLVSVRIFYPPNDIRRDADNFGASLKSYQDGIFWYLEDKAPEGTTIDDSKIKTTVNLMGPTLTEGSVYYMLFPDTVSFWINKFHEIRKMASK